MASRSATLREVADRAGVHPATVSRTLNATTRHLVKRDTAERVLAAVRELEYRPNPIARSLRTSRSLTVGVVLPDLTNPLFPPMVRGIEDTLAASGFTALIANTDNDPQREASVFEAMRVRQVDGLVAATARRTESLVALAARAGTPTVLMNRRLEGDRLSAVLGDDRDGVRQAVAHLAALGHEQIAEIAGPQELSTGADRHAAFVDAMSTFGLDVPDQLVVFGDSFTELAGARATRALISAGSAFTAIVAGNDLMALGAYDVLKQHGVRVPDQVSVVGFNDMPFADKFNPPLTTVRSPHYEMGARAAALLLDQLDGSGGEPQTVLLAVSLVVRDSTALAPRRRGRSAEDTAGGGLRNAARRTGT